MNSCIYIIKHKPYFSVESEIFKTISPMEGDVAEFSSDKLINIADENSLYAEYSTFYWVWKNVKKLDIVGFFHYRRYLSLNLQLENVDDVENLRHECRFNQKTLENLLNEYDLIVPEKVVLDKQSIIQQFYLCHDPYYLNKSLEIISKKYPYMLESLTNSLVRDKGYFCNIFISKWDIFDEYMRFIFDIFDDIKKEMPNYYQSKILAYLGERLFNGYVEYLKAVKNKKILEAPILFIKEGEKNYLPSIGWSFD